MGQSPLDQTGYRPTVWPDRCDPSGGRDAPLIPRALSGKSRECYERTTKTGWPGGRRRISRTSNRFDDELAWIGWTAANRGQ